MTVRRSTRLAIAGAFALPLSAVLLPASAAAPTVATASTSVNQVAAVTEFTSLATATTSGPAATTGSSTTSPTTASPTTTTAAAQTAQSAVDTVPAQVTDSVSTTSVGAGAVYTVKASVRATVSQLSGAVRLHEVSTDNAVSVTQELFTLTDTSWHAISFTVTTKFEDATLELQAIADELTSGQALKVDNMSVVLKTSGGTSTTPTPTPTPSPTPTSTPTADPDYREGWTLVEDVDLSSSTGWVAEKGTASNTASQDLPQNVTFSEQGLRIVGTRGGATNSSPYTSGDAKGTGHVIPNYTRIEVTGRGPAEQGMWPAVLWLRPLTGSDGEIDLMENFGGQPRTAATLHNEYGSTHKMIHGNLAWSALANPDPAAMHTYVMEKTPNSIKIWTDGVLTMDAGPADAPAGFDWARIFERDGQTWYPRVTLQIGCGVANPTCATGSPAASFTQTDMLITDLKIYAMNP